MTNSNYYSKYVSAKFKYLWLKFNKEYNQAQQTGGFIYGKNQDDLSRSMAAVYAALLICTDQDSVDCRDTRHDIRKECDYDAMIISIIASLFLSILSTKKDDHNKNFCYELFASFIKKKIANCKISEKSGNTAPLTTDKIKEIFVYFLNIIKQINENLEKIADQRTDPITYQRIIDKIFLSPEYHDSARVNKITDDQKSVLVNLSNEEGSTPFTIEQIKKELPIIEENITVDLATQEFITNKEKLIIAQTAANKAVREAKIKFSAAVADEQGRERVNEARKKQKRKEITEQDVTTIVKEVAETRASQVAEARAQLDSFEKDKEEADHKVINLNEKKMAYKKAEKDIEEAKCEVAAAQMSFNTAESDLNAAKAAKPDESDLNAAKAYQSQISGKTEIKKNARIKLESAKKKMSDAEIKKKNIEEDIINLSTVNLAIINPFFENELKNAKKISYSTFLDYLKVDNHLYNSVNNLYTQQNFNNFLNNLKTSYQENVDNVDVSKLIFLGAYKSDNTILLRLNETKFKELGSIAESDITIKREISKKTDADDAIVSATDERAAAEAEAADRSKAKAKAQAFATATATAKAAAAAEAEGTD